MNTLDKEFLDEYMKPLVSNRGCAFLGKTEFDKLQVVKDYLMRNGFSEFSGKGSGSGNFAVVDCHRQGNGLGFVQETLGRLKGCSYVIFDNCEGILSGDDVLREFAHMVDPDEYGDSNPEDAWPFFVFLGEGNTILRKKDFSVGSAEVNHVDSFCTFIHVYDFGMGGRFFG